ncbi:hypothetical protein I6I98_13035 [Sphingobacterium multivorum]|uniref:Uncharacterized protein n=1 Tax=Sphingobacterium multivorum TaxID=28454 RepID=A0ABX7CVN4_SPHMU|nr:hypothetical protein [Sphingobacterium multivorum]QQT56127.1 hypothetical protein I6I98_13035 [Sphingobacterium multivorum]
MDNQITAAQCYDITTALGGKNIPEFESLPRIGMMVSLALHLRGLPIIEYEKLKLVSDYYFKISPILLREILECLEEVGFVQLFTEKKTIKKVLPKVPFFDDIYSTVGKYANLEMEFNEPEQLALRILSELTNSPTERSNIYSLGAEKRIVDRNLQFGTEGGYIVPKRARGRDILISPLFFSENADIFADLTAKSGANTIKKVLTLVKKAQGWPLSVIEKTKSINGESITEQELHILKRLAQDGAVKPPAIVTAHSGENYFMFTPAPGASKLNPTNREIYERAMAILASVRQGQLLAKKYAIRSPILILNALKRNGWLSPTSETYAQYHQLTFLKVGRLERTSGDRYKFSLIDSQENKQALDLAIDLLENGGVSNMEIDQDARIALQKDQTYIDSIVSSSRLRESETVSLDEEAKEEFDNMLLKGISR